MKQYESRYIPNQLDSATLIVSAAPEHANPDGDIFGGWMMSQMDLAGAIAASKMAKSRVATVAVKQLQFIKPVFSYDVVHFHTSVSAVGKTSITVEISALADRNFATGEKAVEVGIATIVYVALQKPGIKRIIN